MRGRGDTARMKHRTALLAAALAAALLGAAADARGQVTAADVNFLVAEKFLGAADWGPTNRQGELGLVSSWRWREWPVLVAVDFLAASREVPIANGSYTVQVARTLELGSKAGVKFILRSDLAFGQKKRPLA